MRTFIALRGFRVSFSRLFHFRPTGKIEFGKRDNFCGMTVWWCSMSSQNAMFFFLMEKKHFWHGFTSRKDRLLCIAFSWVQTFLSRCFFVWMRGGSFFGRVRDLFRKPSEEDVSFRDKRRVRLHNMDSWTERSSGPEKRKCSLLELSLRMERKTSLSIPVSQFRHHRGFSCPES